MAGQSIFIRRPWLTSFVTAAVVLAPALVVAVWLDALDSAGIVLFVIYLVWAVGAGIRRSRAARDGDRA